MHTPNHMPYGNRPTREDVAMHLPIAVIVTMSWGRAPCTWMGGRRYIEHDNDKGPL